MKNVRWTRTDIASIHNAHKSFESIILRKMVTLKCLFTTEVNEFLQPWFTVVGAELETLLSISDCCCCKSFTVGHCFDIFCDLGSSHCTSLRVNSSFASCDLLKNFENKCYSLEAQYICSSSQMRSTASKILSCSLLMSCDDGAIRC